MAGGKFGIAPVFATEVAYDIGVWTVTNNSDNQNSVSKKRSLPSMGRERFGVREGDARSSTYHQRDVYPIRQPFSAAMIPQPLFLPSPNSTIPQRTSSGR